MTPLATPVSLRRSPGPTYAQILATDTHRVPDHFWVETPGDFGTADIPITRYTSRAYFEAEKTHVWRKVWQMACRLEQVPVVGDTFVYDICDLSFIIVRVAPDQIKAYWNFCRHRGRQLLDQPCRVEHLRCPFHGLSWNLDGSLHHLPSAWDFPQIDPTDFGLVEVSVDAWGGFVFINPDPHAGPLADYLGEVVEHFAPWRLEDRYLEAHVAKIYRANWKTVQEAFMESYHVGATHPQQLVRLGDTNSQHDCFDHVNRSLHPSGTPSPHLNWTPTEQEMLDSMLDVRVDETTPVVLPAGETLRSFAARISREALRPVLGEAAEHLSDAELVDAIEYSVFPNFHPWASYQRVVYRFRPNGDDHTSSIMDVMLLSPFVGERPAPAKVCWVGPDESWTAPEVLGITGRILDQDSFNLPRVAAGLASAPVEGLVVSAYQESRIRHFHHLLERYIGHDDQL
jgi:phenylpropionate dioxygenase-like ring-hydroxylating dioxygenase large terminal subunit